MNAFALRPLRRFCQPVLAILAVCHVIGADPVQAQEGRKFLTLQGVSSATVAPNGTGFASVTGSFFNQGPGPKTDGSLELGFGLGSAEEGIGVQVTSAITSLTDDFADSGYIGLKFSRLISGGANPTYVSLEGTHLLRWGEAKPVKPRGKIAVTTFGIAQLGAAGQSFPYMLTIGAGDKLRNNQSDPGLFFGAGLGISETTALSAAWTGDTFDLGVSFRPVGLSNATFNAMVNDVADSENSRRLTLSVNWAMPNLFGG